MLNFGLNIFHQILWKTEKRLQQSPKTVLRFSRHVFTANFETYDVLGNRFSKFSGIFLGSCNQAAYIEK